MEAIPVLLVETNPTFRQVAVRFLSEQRDVALVGVAGDAREMLLLAGVVRPRVVVLDLAATDPPGLIAIESLRETVPETGIVAVGLIDQGYRRAALDAGADAFVVKESMWTALLPAIRRAARAHSPRSGAGESENGPSSMLGAVRP